jgi:hypothetical protein
MSEHPSLEGMMSGWLWEAPEARDSLPRVSMPLDVTDETLFPEMAKARAWLASMSAEQRAELDALWESE